MKHTISPFDASTLNTIVQTNDDATRKRLVEHLDGEHARAIGDVLLQPPDRRDSFDTDTREDAEKLERWISAAEEASAEAEAEASEESYAY